MGCFGPPTSVIELRIKEAELLKGWQRGGLERLLRQARWWRPLSEAIASVICEFGSVPRALTCSQCVLPG